MKLKFLHLLMLISGLLNAQEPNRSLVISESRMDATGHKNHYVELTNMGDTPISLGEFKIGVVSPWAAAPIFDVWNDPFTPLMSYESYFLPEVTLPAGESYVITVGFDFGPKQYQKKVNDFQAQERPKQLELYDVADLVIHAEEAVGEHPDDSVTVGYSTGVHNLFGRECLYIEHHFAEGDSAVVDQVNGIFDCDGRNCNNSRYNVAGVEGASGRAILIRKFSVKTGNLDFANARGVGLEDSEWIPIVPLGELNSWRDLWWTAGNHGPYVLDENTLESDVIDVDFAGKILTVPWGVRRLDDIMRHMEKKPGIAWNYHLNPNREDSLYLSAQTGDSITIYVVGEGLTSATFGIIVSEPTADDNIVVPMAHVNIGSEAEGGSIRTDTQSGIDGLAWPRVTTHGDENDTITGTWHGLPHALRTDSLQKYLEKPANATWEFVWVDDIPRPDLKNGDKLKVVSANGTSKEYYLQVQPYYPSFNANLSAIQWPEIPAFYKGIFGWIGDTIPNFSPSGYNYRVEVPLGVERTPHIVAKTQDLNAKLDVKRATNLGGSLEDRTISFKVTAENDTTVNTYNIELYKEKDPDKIQPWEAEPFLSEYVFRERSQNDFAEICNPGTLPLDLSNYMITMFIGDPASAIARLGNVVDWRRRYDKYVPGYKWVNENDWVITPGILEPDLNVNSIVQPGGVFTMSLINMDDQYIKNMAYYESLKINVNFSNKGTPIMSNPWNEITERGPLGWANTWNIFIFKILNDSIKLGLKPATDPYDFELIEAFGMVDNTTWTVAGIRATQVMNWRRKPGIFKANPLLQSSFGTNPDDSEWIVENRADWIARGYTSGQGWLMVSSDIGKHFVNEPTHYKSTVSSVVYKVSDGYSMAETIRGIVTGISVADFKANIIKAHEGQTLTVKSGDTELEMDDLLSMDDVLVVLSADSANTSQYILEVSEDGLSSNAVITSERYDVTIDQQPKSVSDEHTAGSGSVSGFEYGTLLSTILNNVNVPEGASLNVVDASGAYVPLKMLNFDTSYVSVTVNPGQFFEVIAEDGVTTINYQLLPQVSESSAFLTSVVYAVQQRDLLVKFVPRGTTVNAFLNNVFPSTGATVKVVDKFGLERTEGSIVQDDKVVVTSSNKTTETVYYLSMLRTQYIQETTYLAYILSDVYNVNQVDYVIESVSGSASMSDFYARIKVASGATAMVVDEDGVEKTSGDIDGTDKVKVTSADGKIVVMYTFGPLTGAADLQVRNQIEIYPNPTNGKLNVRGVKPGNRIQVFNSTGAIIYDVNVRNSIETFSLNEQPSGLYLIVVSNDSKLLGRFKALRN